MNLKPSTRQQPWLHTHEQDTAAPDLIKPSTLRLRPDGFVHYLQQRHGFRLVCDVAVGAAPSLGFDRPIHVFCKEAGGSGAGTSAGTAQASPPPS